MGPGSAVRLSRDYRGEHAGAEEVWREPGGRFSVRIAALREGLPWRDARGLEVRTETGTGSRQSREDRASTGLSVDRETTQGLSGSSGKSVASRELGTGTRDSGSQVNARQRQECRDQGSRGQGPRGRARD